MITDVPGGITDPGIDPIAFVRCTAGIILVGICRVDGDSTTVSVVVIVGTTGTVGVGSRST